MFEKGGIVQPQTYHNTKFKMQKEEEIRVKLQNANCKWKKERN